MKSCTKCGNLLLDEAVDCPKCGCVAKPSEQKQKDFNNAGTITTKQIILVALAFLIAIGGICLTIASL